MRIAEAWERIRALPEVKTVLQVGQFASSLLFVVLYVWATYHAPAPFSWRSNLDLLLCLVFAIDYSVRYTVGPASLIAAVTIFLCIPASIYCSHFPRSLEPEVVLHVVGQCPAFRLTRGMHYNVADDAFPVPLAPSPLYVKQSLPLVFS